MAHLCTFAAACVGSRRNRVTSRRGTRLGQSRVVQKARTKYSPSVVFSAVVFPSQHKLLSPAFVPRVGVIWRRRRAEATKPASARHAMEAGCKRTLADAPKKLPLRSANLHLPVQRLVCRCWFEAQAQQSKSLLARELEVYLPLPTSARGSLRSNALCTPPGCPPPRPRTG